jgi:hypothetical protein
MVFRLSGLGAAAGIGRCTIEIRRLGATKAEQFNGGYDFFRCPNEGIASKALAISDSPPQF